MKRPMMLLAALLATVAAVAVGCNLVVDAGGYKVGTVDASSGDDTGVDAGPVSCGQGVASGADFDQLVQSCLLAVSCDPYYFDVNVSVCIGSDYLHSREAYTCLTTAQTCADFTKCQHERRATVAECPNSGKNASCGAANLAINCTAQGAGAVIDCPALGGKCVTLNGVADCVDVPSCTQTDGLVHCGPNNDAYTCINGQGFGFSCGTGFTCGMSGDAGSGCLFNAPNCPNPNSGGCNGTTRQFCTSGRQLFSFDCALPGSSCQLDDAGVAHCVSPGCSIDTQVACKESCGADKKTLNTCIGGAPYAIDCTKYGFTACVQTTDTATSVVYTVCE